MRRRTQAEMDQLVEAAGFEKIEQRIDEWGIFTVSLAQESVMNATHLRHRRQPFWLRSLAWLRCSLRFFLSYGFANQQAAAAGVGSIFFSGNGTFRSCSLDDRAPTGRSIFCTGCRSCSAARRAESIAMRCACSPRNHFRRVLPRLPAAFRFRAAAGRWCSALMFDVLTGFDLPYNQAPSLHISLLVIIWIRFAQRTEGFVRVLVDGWALLIGVSVLTTTSITSSTFPTGAAVGLICLWLLPDEGRSPPHALFGRRSSRYARRRSTWSRRRAHRRRLSVVRRSCLGDYWISLALSLTAIVYFSGDADGFQKPMVAMRVRLPHPVCAVPVSRPASTRGCGPRRHSPDHIAEGVWLGRHPDPDIPCGVPGRSTLLDLCPGTLGATPWAMPQSAVARSRRPDAGQLDEAAQAISRRAGAGPCWSAARSATRAAPVPSSPGCIARGAAHRCGAAIEHDAPCRPHRAQRRAPESACIAGGRIMSAQKCLLAAATLATGTTIDR